MKNKIVCVELGGNIRPESYLPRAANALRARFDVLGTSQVWETPPVGCEGCENFLNAALLIRTDLNPNELKIIFQDIEASLDRVRTEDKFAPRTIDLDILIYDEVLIETELWDHAHLAVPVAELLPDFSNKDSGKLLSEVAGLMQIVQTIKLRKDVRLD